MSEQATKTIDAATCECGGKMEPAVVDVTLSTARGPVLIENVPVQICNDCQEQYYDKDASLKIQELISQGFPRARAVREITVPVFSIEGGAVPHLPEDIEHQEERS